MSDECDYCGRPLSSYGFKGDECASKHARLATEEEKLAQKVIRFFAGRRGFNGWWGNIDGEIQEEIRADLAKMLKK